MDVRRLVGWNIRRIRVEREMSIETLAGEAELEPSYMGKVERGEVNSSIDTLARLSRVLRIEIRDLFNSFPPGARAPRPLPRGRRSKKALSADRRRG
jgi:transcriptional regulator with XRE-family HTH domain